MEYINQLENNIIFELLEKKTNVQKKLWMYSGIGLCLYILTSMSVVSNLIGFVYPAYMTYKALKTKKHVDDEQWLIYWIVYSLLSFMELFVNILLAWIPFYYHIKLCALLWLSSDKTRGANLLYKNYIEPNLIKNENKIDEIIKQTEDLVKNAEDMKDDVIGTFPMTITKSKESIDDEKKDN